MVFVLWIVFALIVGNMGQSRKIGFGGAFFLSLLLSPIIGLIIVLMSPNATPPIRSTVDTLDLTIKPVTDTVNETPKKAGVASIADELEKLHNLKEKGILSEIEYEQQKALLLN